MTLYFKGTVTVGNDDLVSWEDSDTGFGNWFEDHASLGEGHTTVPASALPDTIDDVIILTDLCLLGVDRTVKSCDVRELYDEEDGNDIIVTDKVIVNASTNWLSGNIVGNVLLKSGATLANAAGGCEVDGDIELEGNSFSYPLPISAAVSGSLTFSSATQVAFNVAGSTSWHYDASTWVFAVTPIWHFTAGAGFNAGVLAGDATFSGTDTYGGGGGVANATFSNGAMIAGGFSCSGDVTINDTARIYDGQAGSVTIGGDLIYTASSIVSPFSTSDSQAPTVTGDIKFTSLTPVAFTSSSDWCEDTSLWIYTTPNPTWSLPSYNVGTIVGDVTFTGASGNQNNGVIEGDVTIEGDSFINNGTINGDVTVDGDDFNNSGTGAINGNLTVYGNNTGTTSANDGYITGDVTVYGTSFWNLVSITGNVYFYGEDNRNSAYAIITGNAYFYESPTASYNAGYINGDAHFYGDTYCDNYYSNSASVTGTAYFHSLGSLNATMMLMGSFSNRPAFALPQLDVLGTGLL